MKRDDLNNKEFLQLSSLSSYDKQIQIKSNGATVHKAASIRTKLQFLLSKCQTCQSKLCPCDLYYDTISDAKSFLGKDGPHG